MEFGALRTISSAPHILVIGSGKGGSGKTTLAMHLAVGLMKAGQRVGTLDIDAEQIGLTHYLENRRVRKNRRHIDLQMALHRNVAWSSYADRSEAEQLVAFEQAIGALAHCDLVIVDTPPATSYLVRLVHMLADTLITPLQDSFLDLCSLGRADPVTFEIISTGNYAAMVKAARDVRRRIDPGFLDWVVIANRSFGEPLIKRGLAELASRIAFRTLTGVSEHMAYRQLFSLGLTAFDCEDQDSMQLYRGCSDSDPQAEMRSLMHGLRLPINERGLRRAAARSEWLFRKDLPLPIDEILADEG